MSEIERLQEENKQLQAENHILESKRWELEIQVLNLEDDKKRLLRALESLKGNQR